MHVIYQQYHYYFTKLMALYCNIVISSAFSGLFLKKIIQEVIKRSPTRFRVGLPGTLSVADYHFVMSEPSCTEVVFTSDEKTGASTPSGTAVPAVYDQPAEVWAVVYSGFSGIPL